MLAYLLTSLTVMWGWCKWCGTQTNWEQGEHGYICKKCGRCPNEQ